MSVRRVVIANGAILYDETVVQGMQSEQFSPEHYLEKNAVVGLAGGRGTVRFVRWQGMDLALRHYQRGGIIGRWLEDHFLWFGEKHVRSFREWRLLRKLHEKGLPVPRPVGARYVRRGLAYTADLITERIPGAVPLSQRLTRKEVSREDWAHVGRCLRVFHDAGVYHADLTAHNILMDESGKMHLLDFDRGKLLGPGQWQRSNLARLHRSLRKISATMENVRVTESDWRQLLEGYG